MLATRSVSMLVVAGLGSLVSLSACTAPGGPDKIKQGFPSTMPVDMPPVIRDLTCKPAASAEMLPARSTVVSSMGGGSTGRIYFTSDLFVLFKSVCGGCHVETSLGGFGVTELTFPVLFDATKMARITTSDRSQVMPPDAAKTLLSERAPTDPVVLLASLLTTWMADGKPDSFSVDNGGQDAVDGFALSPQLGSALSNIGSCVPGKDLVASNKQTMNGMDAMFATATELPDTLDQTDLVSLDSDVLARNGVISYAPTYPLWSDSAGKMRYVRVPLGQSIKFDKATQTFKIPPNTRFYKTFLKQVVDADGNESFRKIETRIIVSRPDRQLPDGTVAHDSLFGAYVWNSDETQAVLLTDPLRNAKPFKDRLVTYIVDEPKAQATIDALAPGSSEVYALEQAHLLRHYALPGSERCIQCHMGSSSQSFVLGFTPLQVARFPKGQSGVIEPAMGDELSQLQRLIDYGVVSGMTSPADVLPLEQSQGTRKPRTAEELTAQAYMVGNCSHCHNPRGFPTMKSPALKDKLNFLPGADGGGIFEMSLELVSPLRTRGEQQNVPIPYITPSLHDYPSESYATHDIDDSLKAFRCRDPNGCPVDIVWITAPWRSLIYRNVDGPFDYVEDRAVFPHMPLNTPGYDCRAAGIMGDWMVSLPSVLKHPGLDENARPWVHGNYSYPTYPSDVDNDVQPYEEVRPGDPRYEQAVAAAKDRLAQYHAGARYDFCPDTRDILDPVIVDQVKNGQPVQPDTSEILDPNDPNKQIMPDLKIPVHAHWVVTDDTDPPGDWFPKRIDWSDALVGGVVSGNHQADDLNDIRNVLDALEGVRLADERDELTRVLPFGIWDEQNKAMPCAFGPDQPTVDSLAASSRPMWMEVANPSAGAHVYQQSAGAALFTSICFNCHGLQADSKGLLADEITLMTGGDARVANLRDGLFGPISAPGTNRARVFGDAAAGLGIGADDLAAHYLAWMALGGTQKNLPTSILGQVSLAPVLGAFRGPQLKVEGTPDMLRLGLKLCQQLLPGDENTQTLLVSSLTNTGRIDFASQTGLIDKNGDSEMWLHVCSLENRPVVRAVYSSSNDWKVASSFLYYGDAKDTNNQPVVPPDAQFMDHRGRVTTGFAGNDFPMCARVAGQAPVVKGTTMPICPPGLFARDGAGQELYALKSVGNPAAPATFRLVDARKWAARGAINAALAVFLYLDGLERGSKPQPLYNQCEQLGK